MIEFRIDTTPQSAPRPRVTRFGVHYDKKYEAYRQEVGLRAKAAMLGREPLMGAVMVVIEFCFEPPASTSNRKREAMIQNEWVIKKPDLDNMEKAVLDSCTGICWKDDKQVAGLLSFKHYAKEPYIRVSVGSIDDAWIPTWAVDNIRDSAKMWAGR